MVVVLCQECCSSQIFLQVHFTSCLSEDMKLLLSAERCHAKKDVASFPFGKPSLDQKERWWHIARKLRPLASYSWLASATSPRITLSTHATMKQCHIWYQNHHACALYTCPLCNCHWFLFLYLYGKHFYSWHVVISLLVLLQLFVFQRAVLAS